MKIITNQKLINRNSRLGQITSLSALGILGLGMFVTFKYPEKAIYSLIALILGFFLAQFGMYYGNRWGRRPRPDEVLDKTLKGLGREYSIYHYLSPSYHLLVGPSGLWVLLHFYQAGKVTYSNKRWRLKGGGFIQSYLKLFGQENIGRPDLTASFETESVHKFLQKKLPETEIPVIKAAAIFSNPDVVLESDEFPIPTFVPQDFKEFLKQIAKSDSPSPTIIKTIQGILPQPES